MEGVPKIESSEQKYKVGETVLVRLENIAGQTGFENVYVGKTADGEKFYVTAQSDELENTDAIVTVESFDAENEFNGESTYSACALSETPPEVFRQGMDLIKGEPGQGKTKNPFADALASLRKEAENEKAPEVPENVIEKRTYEKGEIVRGVELQRRADGKYVSSGGQERKAFLVDESSIDSRFLTTQGLRLDNFFAVKIKNDTAPGKSTGFIIVELIGPESVVDESGQLDEEAIKSEPVQVENGVLDISLYTPEQLENVEGIESGTVFKNVFFKLGQEFSQGQTYESEVLVNGEKLVFFNDTIKPEKEGVYDFMVGRKNVFGYLGSFAENSRSAEAQAEFDIAELFDDIEETATPERVTILSEELADIPEHTQMLKAQARRLKTPEIQTALQQAHAHMLPYSSGAEVLRRSRDMRSAEATETISRPDGTTREVSIEKHRHFTALGSAMYREKAAYRAFNAGVDTAVEHSSVEMRAWLENWEGEEPPRLPVLVIGTGPHGATFLSTYAMYNQSAPAVAVDQRARIGGQFASAEEPVLRLNSRNRPQKEGDEREQRNLPGTEQTINPLGTMATLQVSDLSGEAYVTQDALAHATRFNTITSVDNFLTECTLLSSETVRRSDGEKVERCVFLDDSRDATFTIDTDNLVIAGGIGNEEFRLAGSDSVTEAQLERESQKLAEGIRPTVMSFPQMVEWFGNPSVQSPIEGVKTAVVSGSGDSANVAVGLLLGYEPGSNRMPVALDRVEKIYWIGQDIPSKEEWLKNVRARYAQVGLELPREEIEGYYSRIIPVGESKVSDVVVKNASSGNTVFGSGELNNTEQVRVLSNDGVDVSADLYIACNGFQNDIPNVLSGDGRQGSRTEQVNNPPVDVFAVPGAYVRSLDGAKELRILRANKNQTEIEYILIENKKVITKRTCDSVELDAVLEDFSFTEKIFSVPARETEYEELFDEEGFPVGKRVVGSNTLIVGPSAELTLSPEEKKAAPVLEKINENTAALFRYGRGTETAARLVAQSMNEKTDVEYDYPGGTPVYTLKSADERIVYTDSSLSVGERPEANAYHVDDISALQLALANHVAKMVFPANLSQLELSIDVRVLGTGVQIPRFEANGLAVPGLSQAGSDEILENWLKGIADDALVQRVIKNQILLERKKAKGLSFVKQVAVDQAIKKVNQNVAGDAQLTAPQVDVQANKRLVIEIPIQGARANVQALKLSWEDA